MRDLGDIRSFIASGAIALPIDLAVTPLFLLSFSCCTRSTALIGLIGTLLLTMVGDRDRVARAASGGEGERRLGRASMPRPPPRSAMPRSIAAMGMLPAVAQRWRQAQARALDSIERGRTVAKALSAVAKTLRIGLQIAVVGAGAVLVIEREATGGTIVAAAVLSARLLLPFEHLIDGWRQWLDAFAAHGPHPRCAGAGRHHPLPRAGKDRARDARRRPASATCPPARTGRCCATCRSGWRPAS